MKTVPLGSQGLQCGEMGLGCMGMNVAYDDLDKLGQDAVTDEITKVFEMAHAEGVTMLNSAEFYGSDRVNEKLIAKHLSSCPHFQVGLKVGATGSLDAGDMKFDASPERLRSTVDESLRILGRNALDVVILARKPPDLDIETVMKAFKELVEAGKVSYVGLSEVGPATIRKAHAIHPITCIEQEWSLWARDIEHGVVPVCKELGIGILSYSPLGRGFLTGSLTKEVIQALPATDFRTHLPRLQGDNLDHNMNVLDKYQRFASNKGVDPGMLALAWVYAQAKALGVTMVAIPGTRKTKYLQKNLQALDVAISSDELQQLNTLFDPANIKGDRYDENHGKLCFDPKEQ